MSTEKLSTGCELSTASLKKREGEKRHSPLNLYREKGKGKEDKPSACSTGLFARAYASTHVKRRLPCTCTYDKAGAAADEIVGNCFGTAGDLGLWAWYCRHFGRRDKALGNKYAKVAYAYFKRRSWRKTGLSESSFFHALKKVKDFFEADKHWTGLTNRRRSRGGRLE